MFDYGEASRLIEKALGVQEVLDPEDKAKRCDLLLALGSALRSAGDPLRAAEETAPGAPALAEAVRDPQRSAQACLLGLQALMQWGGQVVGGRADFKWWTERANRYARPDTLERVVADHAFGTIAVVEGRFAEAHAHRDRALRVARRLGDDRALWTGAWAVFGIAPSPGMVESRLALAREFSERSTDGISARDVGSVLNSCFVLLLSAGERDRAGPGPRERRARSGGSCVRWVGRAN